MTELAALQKVILKSAAAMLKEGGMLMYSTCTFSAEENEMNVSWLLDNFPEFEPADIEWYEGFDHGRKEFAGGDARVEKSVRIWPHRMDGEGHFLALFIKKPAGGSEGIIMFAAGVPYAYCVGPPSTVIPFESTNVMVQIFFWK